MAMLAERKRKQKWSLNPRGKDWAEDTNKFGQKLLEKMGWSQGKGLGTNENGITEHIKLSYKNDSKGMGYKETNDQWTEHEKNFTSLLENLTGGKQEKEELKLSSLEKKSQASRARVHYHKFTRGKDLSRYSEKDLANIFGKKSLKQSRNSSKTTESDQNEEKGQPTSSFTINGGSMTDYFKKKLVNFGVINNGYVIGNNGVLKKEEAEESESEMRPSFGFGFKTAQDDVEKYNTKPSTFVSYINTEPSNESITRKKDKKKKKKSEENLDEPNALNGLSNPAFDPLPTPLKMEKHILHTIEEHVSEDRILEEETSRSESIKKVKKRKAKLLETNCLDDALEENLSPRKKSKKCLNNVAIEESAITELIEENLEPKKQKSKKMLNCNNDEGVVENDFEQPKKKKKSKQHLETNGIENLVFDENDSIQENVNSEIVEENPYEVKIKKKKTKKKHSSEDNLPIENPTFNPAEKTSIILEDNAVSDNNNYEIKRKKKKSKHKTSSIENDSIEVKEEKSKSKKLDQGLDNPALNLNDSTNVEEEESCDLMLNVVTTPLKKSKTKDDCVNETFTVSQVNSSSIKRRKSVRFSDVTQERIIPNNDDLLVMETIDLSEENSIESNEEKVKKKKKKSKSLGVANTAFDIVANALEENIESITQTIDNYQAEVENDINEKQLKTVEIDDIMVGEMGNPDGKNEQLPDGHVKLKFKYANFGKTPGYLQALTGPKKSYKHLIKGDIVLAFKNANLHEIEGYTIGSIETAV